jgi:hypothetical protein
VWTARDNAKIKESMCTVAVIVLCTYVYAVWVYIGAESNSSIINGSQRTRG